MKNCFKGERMKRKNVTALIIFLILISMAIILAHQNGYSFSENKALQNSHPFRAGEVVYENDFGNKKIVVWKTDQLSYVKLVTDSWGILHRVSDISELHEREPNDSMKRTWSAHLNSNNKYETMFAVEATDPEIKKVIVSNENTDDAFSENLNEIKENSTVFVEMTVKDGFAASYLELGIHDAGGFVFRGLDEQGEIIAVIK